MSAAPSPSCTAIEAALASVLREPGAPAIVSAYLFGSVAESRAHRESDVDLGVLLAWPPHPDRAQRFEIGLILAGRLEGALGRVVDLVVLNDAPPLLGRHVVTRGVRVACLDARADHDFVRDVQLRAADVAPWLERFRATKLEALRR